MILEHENIRKIATGQGDDNTTGCWLDYPYFKDNYKMIAIDLSKWQALDADLRAIKEINVTTNLDRVGNKNVFHYLRSKGNCLRLFTRNCKSFVNVL